MDKAIFTTLSHFQNYIEENNINSKSEFRRKNKYLLDKFYRVVPKEQHDKLIFNNNNYKKFGNTFLTVTDFQNFIEANNIERPSDFKKLFPKIYDRLCRILTPENKKKLIYKRKKNSYEDIDDINKLQEFINNNNIHSRKELHYCFSGLYVKFANQLDKVSFIKNNFSLGENCLINLFNKNNIKYITQKTYPDLKNTLPLRYDFYLPEYNILIEHHGEGHFRKGKYYSEELLINDKHKYEYANDHNIPILYYTIYVSTYKKFGYFCNVITDDKTLIEEIKRIRLTT